jgi:hypothetical protein
MKRLLLIPLLAAGCFQGPGWSGDPGMMMHMGPRRERPWPTVRIDEPAGATVVMEQGVFGDGIHATAPLEGQFQPTARSPRAGYPLAFELDAATAHRYGINRPLTLYGRLNVNRTMIRHGILVLSPSECELRALVAGDLEEVVVQAEILPTADEACRRAAHPAGAACPMHGDPHGDAHAAAHAHEAMPVAMHEGAMHDGCNMGGASCGGMHDGCGMHAGGCGKHDGCCKHGHAHHCPFSPPPPGASLTLRLTKF